MLEEKSIILLIAHGSRKTAANQEVLDLARDLSDNGPLVIGCFLEIAQPDIPTALERAIQEKPDLIKILPYFLTQGRHVTEDIPRIIEEKQRALASPIAIEWLDYLGSQSRLKELLQDLILR